MGKKPARFEIRLAAEMETEIDEWRRAQPDIPSRAEAARRLIELALRRELGGDEYREAKTK